MKYFKTKFLKLPIKNQIHVGIFIVTTFFLLLSISLIIFNIYIVLARSYSDILKLIENFDNEQLDYTSNLIDNQLFTFQDFALKSNQLLRRYFKNFHNNPDFNSNFTWLNSSITEICFKNLCLNSTPTFRTPYFKTLFMMIPLIYMNFNIRIMESNHSITDNIYIYLDDNSSYITNSKNSTFLKLKTKDEFLSELNYYDQSKFLNFSPIYSNSIESYMINSLNYNTISALSTDLSKNLSISNIMLSNLNQKLFSEIVLKNTRKLTNILSLITSNDQNKNVINDFQCSFLRELSKFFTLTSENDNFSRYTLNDCFVNLVPNLTTHLDNTLIKRKLFLQIFPPNQRSSIGIYYKIFQYFSMDLELKYQNRIQNPFLSFNIFVLKDQTNLKNIQTTFYIRYSCSYFTQIVSLVILWYIIILSLFYLLIRTSHSITHPIKELISAVRKIGIENQYKIKELLNKVTFKDDSDISELIKICSNYTQLGIVKIASDKNSTNFTKAHYNISFLKFNNIIVDEKKILKKTLKKNKKLFNYENPDFTLSPGVEIRESPLLEPRQDNAESTFHPRKTKTTSFRNKDKARRKAFYSKNFDYLKKNSYNKEILNSERESLKLVLDFMKKKTKTYNILRELTTEIKVEI